MRLPILVFASLPLVLTACGGGGGGGGTIGTPPAPTASLGEVYRTVPFGDILNDSVAIDQAMRNNPEFTAGTEQGATGVLAMARQYGGTPVLRDVRMSLNNDRSVLTLQIQGMGSVDLPVDGSASSTSGTWGDFFDSQRVRLVNFFDTGTIDYSDLRNLTSPTYGSGILGLETPLDRLPASTATYDGDFDMIGVPATLTSPVGFATDGTFAMVLDFTDGSVGGTTTGTITYFNGASFSDDTGATGTISGTISGNGLSGVFTLDGSVASASHSYEGNLYGYDATEIGGGVIGTVTGPNGSSSGYGAFRGDLR